MASELQSKLDELGAYYREHGGEGSQPLCDQVSGLLEKNFQEQSAKLTKVENKGRSE